MSYDTMVAQRKTFFLLLTVCILASVQPAKAQYFQTGEDPARIRWSQIRTGPFQIIYPQGIDSLAFRYAWLLEHTAPEVLSSLGVSSPSIPVVLHPYNTNSNGVVSWAPKRIELITTPASERLIQNWEKQLVLHEMRHVGQMRLIEGNFFRILGWFLGEQSAGISAGLYFPKWVLEGDAVLAETLYSYAGRGREAAFLMPYKAYFLSDISYSYDKWRYGSYRHHIPNHYALGYMKLSVAQYYSGDQALARVFSDITKYPYWPFVYEKTYRKNFGNRAIDLWEPAVRYYTDVWKTQDARKQTFDPGILINSPVKDYVSYTSVAVTDNPDGTNGVYAIKSSLAETERLVYFPQEEQGEEETMLLLGNINSSVNAGDEYLYWSETVSSYRWAHENFSVIIRYNTLTGKKTVFHNKDRYFNPNPSHCGQLLGAVQYQPTGISRVHVLDAQTGAVLEAYDTPNGEYPNEMTWSEDDRLLYVLLTGEDGTGLYVLDRETGVWDTLFPPDFQSLADIMEFENMLYFKTDKFLDTDNIYALDLKEGHVCRLTDARFGAFDPLAVKKDSTLYIYYSYYTPQGYQLYKIPTQDLLCLPADMQKEREDVPLLASGIDTRFSIDALSVPQEPEYQVEKYSKWKHAFKVHSWMPFYFNYDRLEQFSFQEYHKAVAAGATIMSQNTLGTLTSMLGYSYHKGFHAGHLKVESSGLLPVISLTVDINDRPHTRTYPVLEGRENNQLVKTDTLPSVHVTGSLQTYIPFTFHRHGWYRGLVPMVQYTYSNNVYAPPRPEERPVTEQSLRAGIRYYQVIKQAPRDIFPRLGFGLNIQGMWNPADYKLFSKLFFVQAYGYLPGILRNQALKWTASVQQYTGVDTFFYPGTFQQPPRGIEAGTYAPTSVFVSGDYAIPIGLGDPSIPDILYIKRLQLIPFADYRQDRYPNKEKTALWSVGTDLLLDFHLFRIGLPLTAGVRYAYTCEKQHFFEFLFSFPTFY